MKAVVDIGSNSIKYSVGQYSNKAGLNIQETGSWVTRLGKGLSSEHKILNPQSIKDTQAALEAMQERFKKIKEKHNDFKLLAVATAAVRNADDKAEVSEMVQKILGVRLEILTGVQEAQYSLLGAQVAAKAMTQKAENFYFIDVGGASTEVSLIHPEFFGHSFDAGAVKCFEGLGLSKKSIRDVDISPFFPESAWEKLEAKISKQSTAIAVGGTLVMAAEIAGAKKLKLGAIIAQQSKF